MAGFIVIAISWAEWWYVQGALAATETVRLVWDSMREGGLW